MSYGQPGSTKKCLDVEFFPCAKEDDVIAALNVTSNGLVVEDSMSVSISDGAKTGSACKRWHTDQDLRGNVKMNNNRFGNNPEKKRIRGTTNITLFESEPVPLEVKQNHLAY